jgi:DNA-3-methyladenine glycosylase II
MPKPNRHILSAKAILDAQRHLSRSDRVMARLILAHGKCPLARRSDAPFHTLASSIINQQLSAKAADTIKRRLAEFAPMPFQPEDFLNAPIGGLRTAGLSGAKARYIRELAERVAAGTLDFEAMAGERDEAVIERLMALPGIGRWTAEMFLIFGLKRPDVLAVGDAGLRRAARMLYGDKEPAALLAKIGAAWRPYRSVASWYLWKHLDGPE